MRPDLSVQGTATAIEGPLLFLRRNVEVGLNEAVEIRRAVLPPKLGRVAMLDQETMVIEVLESTAGLGLADVRVRFLGEPTSMGQVTTAVLDDTCGNYIQIASVASA